MHPVHTLVLPALLVVLGATSAFPQTLVTLDEARRQIAVGDEVIVVPANGTTIAGRLMGMGTTDLDIRPRNAPKSGLRDVTIPLDTIRSLDRPTDSVLNGIAIGAAAGAAVGGAFFLYALAVDRNEVDEWAPIYLGLTAVSTALGATIGLSIDLARSKPHIRFSALRSHGSIGRTTIMTH